MLVEAAAGGVGSLLVQLAVNAGAQVVAAAGGDHKLALARARGAATAVDYRRADWTDKVREAVGAVDVVLDGVGGGIADDAFGLLADGGRMLTFGASGGAWPGFSADEVGRRGIAIVSPPRPSPDEMRRRTAEALRLAAAGALTPLVGQIRPLDHVSAAHAAIEARRTVGKTLLAARPDRGDPSPQRAASRPRGSAHSA